MHTDGPLCKEQLPRCAKWLAGLECVPGFVLSLNRLSQFQASEAPHLGARLDGIVGSIHHHRQAKQEARGQPAWASRGGDLVQRKQGRA